MVTDLWRVSATIDTPRFYIADNFYTSVKNFLQLWPNTLWDIVVSLEGMVVHIGKNVHCIGFKGHSPGGTRIASL